MAIDPLSAGFELGKVLVDKLWPDPSVKADKMRELEELRQKGDLANLNAHVQLMLAQANINAEEAKHKSVFVAGWRPAIGWVGVAILAFAYIPKSIVLTAMWAYQCYMLFDNFVVDSGLPFPALPTFPDLGVTDVIGLLLSILGVGAMRSIDKYNKVQTDRIG